MSLLGFHAMAAARGDGLRPELRDLLQRRQAMESDARITDLTGVRGEIVQSGPNPTPAPGAFRPGNVIDFKLRAAESALDGQTGNAAKGTA